MNRLLVTCCVLLTAVLTVTGESVTRRFLYATSPDGAQQRSGSGRAILVFDIDDGHRFVRRIDMPVFKEGLRGFTASAVTKCVYYSTTVRTLGCYNLETDKVAWESKLPLGCDRSSITMDGKRIYVPSGWWWTGKGNGFLVVDAATGKLIKQMEVGPKAHNSIASLDGKYIYLGTQTTLTVFNAADGSRVKTIPNVGEAGVFPFTVDSSNRYAYVCLGRHVGFDVVDLDAGKAIHRVKAGDKPIPHRTHGAGMTPDEKELWISDQEGKKLFVFDLTKMPPAPMGHVDLSTDGHGWVCFSLDGKLAWCHTPDVFDVATKKVVATLKDENGKPFGSSKFVEVHIREGKVVRVGNEFGLGRVAFSR